MVVNSCVFQLKPYSFDWLYSLPHDVLVVWWKPRVETPSPVVHVMIPMHLDDIQKVLNPAQMPHTICEKIGKKEDTLFLILKSQG